GTLRFAQPTSLVALHQGTQTHTQGIVSRDGGVVGHAALCPTDVTGGALHQGTQTHTQGIVSRDGGVVGHAALCPTDVTFSKGE
ncbi:MAG: hypothetical protein Q8O33_15880, partial [Pseudomonadota bacterium]|nr:hypothetical protein [Pseudomonadota bacterium]